MTVKELIRMLEQFDKDLCVIVRNEETRIETPILAVIWNYDGNCKIATGKEIKNES